MKNNKGFTLVEVLAMMVVLGILMAVTVPNITGILNSHRINIAKTDAKKMADRAKIKVAKSNIKRPKNGECLILALNYLNDNDDIVTGPNGGKYLLFDSFVIYKREGNSYQYYVRLVEEESDGFYGIELENISNIKDDKDDMIKIIDNLVGLTKDNEAEHLDILKANPSVNTVCPADKIIAYYPGNLKTYEDIKNESAGG